jgi:hypothetical protein
VDAFEALAGSYVVLGPRIQAAMRPLIHPVFSSGRVFGWEVAARPAEPLMAEMGGGRDCAPLHESRF